MSLYLGSQMDRRSHESFPDAWAEKRREQEFEGPKAKRAVDARCEVLLGETKTGDFLGQLRPVTPPVSGRGHRGPGATLCIDQCRQSASHHIILHAAITTAWHNGQSDSM
jgi:hypothetical protein